MKLKELTAMAFAAATLLGGPALAHEDNHPATQTQATRFTDIKIVGRAPCIPELNSSDSWAFTANENGQPVHGIACRRDGETDTTFIVVPATTAQPS